MESEFLPITTKFIIEDNHEMIDSVKAYSELHEALQYPITELSIKHLNLQPAIAFEGDMACNIDFLNESIDNL